MAGTPTPNYQFPTYAETDTPNLAGAYNQAVNAIDAKIKEVADSVSSGGDVSDASSTTKGIAKLYDSATVGAGDQDDGGITPKAVDDKIGGSLTGYAPKFTAAAPITYRDNQIGIRYSNPAADGAQNGYGAVQVTGKQSDVAEADSLTTATVPNVKAVKDYVDAKVPTEQLAYTGTAPIVVDNGERKIGITTPNSVAVSSGVVQPSTPGAVYLAASNLDAIRSDVGNAESPTRSQSSRTVPSVGAMVDYVAAHGGTAYTGTAPITVDSGSRTIGITRGQQILTQDVGQFIGQTIGQREQKLTPVYSVASLDAYNEIVANDDEEHNWPAGWTAPTCAVVSGVIKAATPDASTSTKGLVQLTTSPASADNTMAVTGSGVVRLLSDRKTNATTNVTVDMLKNLYVDTTTGVVYYKAPTK